MVIKCLCFDGVKKTVKIVRFVLESCTFRFRDYTPTSNTTRRGDILLYIRYSYL